MQLNEIACIFGQTNTGEGQCGYIPSPEVYDVLMPKGTRITAAMAVDFKTTLTTALLNDDQTLRWFSIGRYSDTEDTGEAESTETFGDGTIGINRDPTSMMLRTITRGTGCTHVNLLGFDQSQARFDVMSFDKNDKALLQKAYNTTTGLFEMAGRDPYMISAKAMPPVTFAAAPRYQIAFGYEDLKDLQRNRAIIDCSNMGIRRILKECRIQSVTIQVETAQTVSGTQVIYLKTSCGNVNLGKLYPTIFNNVANYKLLNGNTGATVALTSATVNAATGAITLVQTTPPASGVPVIYNLAAVSTLATAGVKYVEGIPITIPNL